MPIQDPDGFLWGLQDTVQKKLILPYQYYYISAFSEGRATVGLASMVGVIDSVGNLIYSITGDFGIGPFQDGYAPLSTLIPHGGRMIKYIDRNGKLLFEKIMNPDLNVLNFSLAQNRAVVDFGRGGPSLMTLSGDTIIYSYSYGFDMMRLLPEGYCVVGLNRKYGIWDINGNEIHPLIFDGVGESFTEGRLLVRKNKRLGFIDENDGEVFYIDYPKLTEFHNGFAMVTKDNKVGFIDREGDEVVPPVYQKAGEFNEGLAYVSQGGKYGFVNTTGNLVIPIKYDRAQSVKNGVVSVTLDKLSGCVNTRGDEIIPLIYDEIYVRDKFVIAKKGPDFIFFSPAGKQLTTVTCDNIGDYGWGYMITRNGKMGTLDVEFKPVIPTIYDHLEWRDVNKIKAQKNNKTGYLDERGNEIFPFKYNEIEEGSGMMKVFLNYKIGLINLSGKEIVPPIYDDIAGFEMGLAVVWRNQKYGAIDMSGKEIIPTIYDKVTIYSYSIEVVKGAETFSLNSLGERIKEEEEY